MSSSDSSTKVYIGDLGSGGSKPELEKEFERYGTLKSVWVARNPPGKLFVCLYCLNIATRYPRTTRWLLTHLSILEDHLVLIVFELFYGVAS